MRLTSSCFQVDGRIPDECAFAVHHPESRIVLSRNLNPDLAWSDLPAGTRSLVVICHDPDVPSVLDDFNQEGRIVSAGTPRIDLYHWALVDVPPDLQGIGKGEFSDAVVPGGKSGPQAPHGTRQGLNDYTQWFAGDERMAGQYFGYDGPCPPWNDEIPHRYVFTLYALDTPTCPVAGIFGARDVIAAVRPHLLGTATLTGRYTLNPEVAI
ncbi:YbhB/YbcL family Raf kinase inhibitor-like protein [Aromatoleum evansii]|uniref:YbhB/YbcL family Raf kinase inhibitor-like protein n=1 Tax=Aromatoleum evansii TaxID=59406 RepID=UPI00145C4566|nr:YbhB/YbcL family Raf kinase inhibitor-like protein [Aromatoleum evansii]NMG28330.1 YbhB/YbcL family Raf kinase inhibitor-like protein [Aromatoleum evansii]